MRDRARGRRARTEQAARTPPTLDAWRLKHGGDGNPFRVNMTLLRASIAPVQNAMHALASAAERATVDIRNLNRRMGARR